MTDNLALQQEINFRLSLLRLVTNAPFKTDREPVSTVESKQIESFAAMVATTDSSR